MRTFSILFKVGFLKLSSYIEASLVNLISALTLIVIQFFVWNAVLSNNGSVTNSFTQIFSYIVFSQIITFVYPVTVGKQLGSLIKSGEISLFLIKPVNLIKQLVYENLGTSVYRFLFISLPVLGFSAVINGFSLYHSNFLLFLVSIILSYITYLFIDLLFGIIQFYTMNSWGINSFKYAVITLFSGKFIPISLYPKWAAIMVDRLPFKYLYDFPLSIIVDLEHSYCWNNLWNVVVWIVILIAIFELFYRKAIRKICIMGG